jgi:hypothetical protein
MEILQRAKHKTSGEIVSFTESEANVREEVNRRTARAGYTTRLGEPTYATKILSTVVWGKEKLNVWPRDEHGHLIGE